jgi:hypothetical protein
MDANNSKSLKHHLRQVRDGKRGFENAYEAVARMVLSELASIEKVVVNGKSTWTSKSSEALVSGGGIHFSDEIFKNKKDLVQVYLWVIQNRNMEIDGFRRPIDTLAIATSNNSEFNRFPAEKEEAPIVDRCRIC